MRILLTIVLSSLSLQASALCLNPFGCKPQTRAECVKQVESTRTEAAARAQLRECTRLPMHTETQCKALTKEWAQYLRSSDGVEWNWPKLTSKADCREHYPETFAASSWVTARYCQAQTTRIETSAAEIDPQSGRSKKLITIGAQTDSIAGLSDRMAVEVLQRIYYKDKTPQDLAIAVFIDSPPDVLQVQRTCASLQAR
jgi:hypothetical protein